MHDSTTPARVPGTKVCVVHLFDFYLSVTCVLTVLTVQTVQTVQTVLSYLNVEASGYIWAHFWNPGRDTRGWDVHQGQKHPVRTQTFRSLRYLRNLSRDSRAVSSWLLSGPPPEPATSFLHLQTKAGDSRGTFRPNGALPSLKHPQSALKRCWMRCSRWKCLEAVFHQVLLCRCKLNKGRRIPPPATA